VRWSELLADVRVEYVSRREATALCGYVLILMKKRNPYPLMWNIHVKSVLSQSSSRRQEVLKRFRAVGTCLRSLMKEYQLQKRWLIQRIFRSMYDSVDYGKIVEVCAARICTILAHLGTFAAQLIAIDSNRIIYSTV